jgi:hypothetical protein
MDQFIHALQGAAAACRPAAPRTVGRQDTEYTRLIAVQVSIQLRMLGRGDGINNAGPIKEMDS